ncbi:protein kinase [Nonomuraea sp. NPDC050328]|uniref:serine/threonine protein kinase n=1 Tax=Nonomuraea sp. NPDC050328 TaxID=3364361 RepID=UPI0037B818E9
MSKLGKVGPYALLERLGRGGMGEVYLATSRRGDQVAVKVLRDLVNDDNARIRLDREVRALRRVESPYVARVLDADLECSRPYLVMEYIDGDTLLHRVRRSGPLLGADLLELARGIATALAIVHAAGIVHRDLKPANILMSDDGPVLIDFGIAQVSDATRLTLTGTFLGTPGYAPPELFADEQVAEPADVYAWAATVAFAATGRPTFGRGTAEAQMYNVLNGQADLKGVPAGLLPLVRASLNREPAKRPTAAMLADRLSRLVKAASDAEPPKPRTPADGRVRGRTIVEEGQGAGERGRAARPAPEEDGTTRTGRRATDDGAARPGRGRAAEDGTARPGRSRVVDEGTGRAARGRAADDGAARSSRGDGAARSVRGRAAEESRGRAAEEARGRASEESPGRLLRGRAASDDGPGTGERVRGRLPGRGRGEARGGVVARVAAEARPGAAGRTAGVAKVRRARRTAEAGAEAPATALPAGNVALLVLAVLAVPCVVATVIWPVATFGITAAFVILTRTLWAGHWLVRNRTSRRIRITLRVLSFPFAAAGAALAAAVWPGVPAAALAGLTLWAVAGGELGGDWWQQVAPVTAAGVVFGVVCGGILGREIERIGARLPDLRREGLRALAVLGGFVALCAAAVRAIALLL